MNYGGYRPRPRRRRRRITGRFYVFLTVVIIFIVFLAVLIGSRSRAPQAPSVVAPVPMATPNIVGADPTPMPQSVTYTGDVAPAPQTGADPAASSQQPQSGVTSITDLMADDEDVPEVIAAEDIVAVNNLSVNQGLPAEWRNFLLLGTDTRDLKKVNRTDTIMIASVNSKTGQVKLVSIMRDLVVPFVNQKGVTKEVKINSLIGRGGVDLVMKTINEVFGMNITEYVMVNFASFQKVVDVLGGVYMDITQEEMEQINLDLGKMAEVAGYEQEWYLANKENLKLKTWGAQTHMTGIQALGYARIRHVGAGDYRRTERQRDLIDSILRKMKSDINVVQIMQLATSLWGEFTTNVDMGNAIGLATTVLKSGNLKLDDTWRIPGTSTSFKSETRSSLGAALYDCDFQANKDLLYKFIYQN